MRPDTARVIARLERERQARLAKGGALSENNGALPQLLDCKALQDELGVKRTTAEAIMRQLDTVQIDGLRKVYVKREDVQAYLEAKTFDKHQVAA